MRVFVKYDSKPPYLPVAVADSKKELALLLGVKYSSVQNYYSERRKYFEIVEIDED